MYGKSKGMGVPHLPKARIAAAALAITLVVLAGCASRPSVDSWGDASLVAEQRLIIEQQRQRLNDMGEAVGRIQGSLGKAIDLVTASLEGSGDLASKFEGIDAFVRRVIDSKRELEELQRSDSGADAGTR